MGDGQPRRSVMDLVNAALEHRKLYRGKAAGGTTFDSYLAPDAPDDEEAEGEEPKRPAETAQVSLTYEIGVSVEFTRGKREAPWELEGCPSGFDPKNISVAGTRYGCLKRWSKPVIGDYPLRVEKSPPRLPNTHWIMTDRGWRRGSLNQRPTIEDESYEAEEVQPEYELQIA
jgi:hypothetical protein